MPKVSQLEGVGGEYEPGTWVPAPKGGVGGGEDPGTGEPPPAASAWRSLTSLASPESAQQKDVAKVPAGGVKTPGCES